MLQMEKCTVIIDGQLTIITETNRASMCLQFSSFVIAGYTVRISIAAPCRKKTNPITLCTLALLLQYSREAYVLGSRNKSFIVVFLTILKQSIQCQAVLPVAHPWDDNHQTIASRGLAVVITRMNTTATRRRFYGLVVIIPWMNTSTNNYSIAFETNESTSRKLYTSLSM